MKTSADPAGRRVFGMFNNCAGGSTPWGTWLTCEENINNYFWGERNPNHREARAQARYNIPSNNYAWGKWHDRFDIRKYREHERGDRRFPCQPPESISDCS